MSGEFIRQVVEIAWRSPSRPPTESHWYLACLRPANHAEIDDSGRDWTRLFGFTVVWYNDATKTWWLGTRQEYLPINDRVIAWAMRPEPVESLMGTER